MVDFATILRKFVEQKKILGKLLEPAELPDMNFPTLQLILSKPRKIHLFFVTYSKREREDLSNPSPIKENWALFCSLCLKKDRRFIKSIKLLDCSFPSAIDID